MPEFYMIFAWKINKVLEFYTTFAEKNAWIKHYVCLEKIFFWIFFRGRGEATPFPVSYAYGWAPGLPPAKSGPAAAYAAVKVGYMTL